MHEEELRKEIRTFEKRIGIIHSSEKGLCNCCYEVNFLQCHIITEIGEAVHITAKEISKELNVDKAFISRAIKDLKNKKYIQTRTCESDKRLVFLSLTDGGKKLYNNIKKEMWNYYSDIINSLPGDKIEQVIESLKLLNVCISVPIMVQNVKNDGDINESS